MDNTKISEKLFETALRDLKSVEILHRNKHYNLALFQLQQTIEKLVKSFGLKTNVIKAEDISKKINHLPHKVFTKLYQTQMEELASFRGPMFVADMIPTHQRGNTKTKENLDNLKGLHSEIEKANQLKSKDLSVEELNKFLAGAKELYKAPRFNNKKLYNEIKDDFVKTNLHFIEYFKGDENVKQISEELNAKSHEIATLKLEQYKLERRRQCKFSYVSYVWINLSLMTSPHEQSTRYPSTTNEECPISLYDHNNIIINHIPEFVKIIKRTIKCYNEVYNV